MTSDSGSRPEGRDVKQARGEARQSGPSGHRPADVAMTAQSPNAGLVERAEAEFTEYYVRNYPGPNTVIYNPHWHAPKIFRAALHALRPAALAPPQADHALVEALSPWIAHQLHCSAQRDLHNDTLCRCGLDDAIAALAAHPSLRETGDA